MKINMDEDTRERVTEEFIKGKSVDDLAKEYGLWRSKMYQIIDARLSNKVFTNQEEDEICQQYLNGMNTTRIGEYHKTNHKCICSILEDHHIQRRDPGLRKWELDEEYFDNIDTPNKAYILGFLYADGYNGIDKSTVRLQLQYTDKEILQKIRVEIGSNKPLHFVKCSDHVASNGFISKDMYSLEFYGKHICEALDKAGVHKGKSLILEYPEFLPEDLQRHFIRGYFDGDGTICNGYFSMLSTEQFCVKCKNIIERQTGTEHVRITDASCHNGVTRIIQDTRKAETQIIMNWLYKDADLYMQRKYDKFRSFYPEKQASCAD